MNSPQEIANCLNVSFDIVFTKEDTENIPDLGPRDTRSPLVNIIITEDMVTDRLMELKPGKSSGPDGIHSKGVCEAFEELVVPLTILYDKSFECGTLPKKWYEAKVVSVFLKVRRDSLDNQKPVSLTSVCGKILEMIIRAVLYSTS